MTERHGSQLFYDLLDKMARVHSSKSHDYATNENPFGNYHFAGMLSKLFNNSDDSGFVGRIGEKLYRLANLENSGKVPSNETIEDTETDIAVITALWMADRKTRRMKAWTEANENKTVDQIIDESVVWKSIDPRNIPHPFKSQNEHPFCEICGLHHSSHAIKEKTGHDPIGS